MLVDKAVTAAYAKIRQLVEKAMADDEAPDREAALLALVLVEDFHLAIRRIGVPAADRPI